MNRRSLIGFLIFLILPLSLAVADAPSLATSKQIGNSVLMLNGAGTRRADYIRVPVYRAALYVTRPNSDAEEILSSTEPKLLELHFLRDVPKDEIEEDLAEGFMNHQHQGPEISARLKQLVDALVDIKRGEQVTFTFYTDRVDVLLPSEGKLTLSGARFCRALLEVWLGKNAARETLRSELLSEK
jgi:hypothetical protein